MRLLRFLVLLAIALWTGALIFFPVVAQTAFSQLPSSHLAGIVVRGSLIKLHWIGLGCGVVFLACSMLHNRLATGMAEAISLPHIVVLLMIAFTAISQFGVIPRMDALRTQAGEISTLSSADPIRVQFDSLHAWSTRIESVVLVLGLIALFTSSRSPSNAR